MEKGIFANSMMALSNFELVAPSIKYRDSFLDQLRGLDQTVRHPLMYNDWPMEEVEKNLEGYVAQLLSCETNPIAPRVPDTILWAVNGSTFLGRISLRHYLNEHLRMLGGHIGYVVCPAHQRQGVASEMLARVLKTDRAKTIGQLLVTCRENNSASIRTIEKNGGKLSGYYQKPDTNYRNLHYWITVT